MAPYVQLETRRISGSGLLIVPPSIIPYRKYWLFADLIRAPRSPYLNLKSNPPESFFGKLCFLNKGRVVRLESVDFAGQAWEFEPDISGQVQIALKCAIDVNNQTSINLGLSLGAPPITVENPLEAFSIQPLNWEEVRLVCFAESAVRLELWAQPYEFCSPYSVPIADSAPDIEFPEEIAPGTPLEGDNAVSPPYDGDNDSGITIPNPIDSFPPEEPEEGTWTITWTYAQTPGLSTCPFLGSPDIIIRSGLSTDEFGLITEGSGGSQIWRLTQNGVPDPIALVEYRCTPTFVPPPEFEV